MKELKSAIDSMGMLICCLNEFCNIDQQLALQDELDRQNIALTG
jgi:hypothetical protein